MRIAIALSLVVTGVVVAAFIYREGDRLSSKANAIGHEHLRLVGMLAAEARGEPNRTELEEFRRDLQARYEPSKTYNITANDLSLRLRDREYELRNAARGNRYWSLAAAALGLLGATAVFFWRRKATPRGETPGTEN